MRSTFEHQRTRLVGRKQTNPLVFAWSLGWQRRMRRVHAYSGWVVCTLLACVLLVVAAWQELRRHGALLAPLATHEFTATVVAGSLGWMAVARSRRRAERQFARSWLASAPVSERDRRVALRYLIAAKVGAPVSVVFAAMASVGVAGAASTVSLLGAPAAGFVVGAAIGWRSGAKPGHSRGQALPRLRRSRPTNSLAASLTPLARWPFARLRADANPVVESRLIGVLLLSLPLGIAPSIALLILALGALSMVAFALLRASLAIIPSAFDWLRTTPLSLDAFVRTLFLRPLAGQIALTLMSGVLAHALGARMRTVWELGAVWLGACAALSAAALVYRHQHTRWRIPSRVGATAAAVMSTAVTTGILRHAAVYAAGLTNF